MRTISLAFKPVNLVLRQPGIHRLTRRPRPGSTPIAVSPLSDHRGQSL